MDTKSLADQYRQQSIWRDWATAMAPLPKECGGTVLDLGCAMGEQASLLAERGFQVIGVDGNETLLEAARRRNIQNASFLYGDLLSLDGLNLPMVDGIWSSFVPAYFPAFHEALAHWIRFLKPGGWIALLEMSDLLDHEPLRPETRRLIEAFYDEAFRAGRYDFRMEANSSVISGTQSSLWMLNACWTTRSFPFRDPQNHPFSMRGGNGSIEWGD